MILDKVRENRLRRMAERQGFRLIKNRRRDPRAYDFGGYMILDPENNGVVAGHTPTAFSFTLNDVEQFLMR